MKLPELKENYEKDVLELSLLVLVERKRHAKTLRELRETKRYLKYAEQALDEQVYLSDWEKLHGAY
jgi:hypothetical protein